MATNARFLRRAGIAPTAVASAIALNGLAGVAIHAVALGLALPWLLSLPGRQVARPLASLPTPSSWWVGTALVLFLMLFGLLMSARIRGWLLVVLGRLRQVAVKSRHVIRDPRRVLGLFAGAKGVTVLHALAFATCVHAVGTSLGWRELVAVYVVGAAAAAAVPTPGGLGAVEAALVFGLVELGTPTHMALPGVLWFRLLSYWLPTLPGLVAFGLLLRRRQL